MPKVHTWPFTAVGRKPEPGGAEPQGQDVTWLSQAEHGVAAPQREPGNDVPWMFAPPLASCISVRERNVSPRELRETRPAGGQILSGRARPPNPVHVVRSDEPAGDSAPEVNLRFGAPALERVNANMAMGRRPRREPRGPQIRINHRIRVPEVRVVDADGQNLGVLATEDALKRAQGKGLDLVEINPKGNPPVCKILDFGKYKYEEKKKQRDAKRKQTVVEIKEIKLRPKTDDHDLNVKVRASRKFIEGGNKVKIVCRFRGREITHPERARMQLDFFVSSLKDIANTEQSPQMEGRTMAVLLAPKPQVLQKIANEKTKLVDDEERERERSDDNSDDNKDRETDTPGDEDREKESQAAATAD